jgi:hypothetical protein
VAWSLAPGTFVAVSGIAAIETIRAVAATLVVVDQRTWDAALPTAERDTSAPS